MSIISEMMRTASIEENIRSHCKDALRYGIPTFPSLKISISEGEMDRLKETMSKIGRTMKRCEDDIMRNWEFNVSRPDMLDLLEVCEMLTRKDPVIVVQAFHKESYTQKVPCGKGKNKRTKEIKKVRNSPVSDNVMVLIHHSIIKKARIIGHILLERVESTEMIDAFVVHCRKAEVEKIVEWVKEVKHASYGDKVDRQLIRVMVRKI